jgi:hypothetical protein
VLQGDQRLGYAIQATLIGGDQIENLAIAGHGECQELGGGKGFAMLPTFAEPANPM